MLNQLESDELVSGSEVEEVMDEGTGQERLQVLFTTKGADILTWREQKIDEGEAVQVLCCPGKVQALVIEVRLKIGRDGMTRVHFGEPYLRPTQEGDRPEE